MICIVFDAATIIAVDDDVWGGVHIFQINQLHALAFLINDFWTFETTFNAFVRPSVRRPFLSTITAGGRLDSIRDPFQALNYRGGM